MPTIYKGTPILVADGLFESDRVKEHFLEASAEIPEEIRTFVADVLESLSAGGEDVSDADWKKHHHGRSGPEERYLADTKRIAVLGIKTEAQSGQAAFYVASYLDSAGLDVIPVPVYYPDVTPDPRASRCTARSPTSPVRSTW